MPMLLCTPLYYSIYLTPLQPTPTTTYGGRWLQLAVATFRLVANDLFWELFRQPTLKTNSRVYCLNILQNKKFRFQKQNNIEFHFLNISIIKNFHVVAAASSLAMKMVDLKKGLPIDHLKDGR